MSRECPKRMFPSREPWKVHHARISVEAYIPAASIFLTRSKPRIGAKIMTDDRQDTIRLSLIKPLDEAAIREFSSKVQGQLIRPQDDGYDEVRTVFYGGFDRHPALIVRVADP